MERTAKTIEIPKTHRLSELETKMLTTIQMLLKVHTIYVFYDKRKKKYRGTEVKK